jgi:hypothetical protein
MPIVPGKIPSLEFLTDGHDDLGASTSATCDASRPECTRALSKTFDSTGKRQAFELT